MTMEGGARNVKQCEMNFAPKNCEGCQRGLLPRKFKVAEDRLHVEIVPRNLMISSTWNTSFLGKNLSRSVK